MLEGSFMVQGDKEESKMYSRRGGSVKWLGGLNVTGG